MPGRVGGSKAMGGGGWGLGTARGAGAKAARIPFPSKAAQSARNDGRNAVPATPRETTTQSVIRAARIHPALLTVERMTNRQDRKPKANPRIALKSAANRSATKTTMRPQVGSCAKSGDQKSVAAVITTGLLNILVSPIVVRPDPCLVPQNGSVDASRLRCSEPARSLRRTMGPQGSSRQTRSKPSRRCRSAGRSAPVTNTRSSFCSGPRLRS